jgi:hypothetical protein
MKIYSTSFDAISGLNNDGFTNDFQLFGNDSLRRNIKGILLYRFKTFSQDQRPVLVKKIKELVIVHEKKTKNEKNK